ncbi:MAG: glycosyltransferase family 2 protein [Oscillospiraceae bacterium]|nr:glycosyltransferase family 2 protein [Oscillospiraceae bacterium]
MKVSVIVPVYNSEKYLRKSLDSIVHQTYSDIEIILVENGSTDKSLNICTEYKERDQRIVLINEKNNVGAGEARNIGLDKAKGEYVCFIDADDWIEHDYIERMVVSVGTRDVAICGYQAFVEGTNKVDHHFKRRVDLPDNPSVQKYAASYFPNGHIGFLWNKIYKLSVIKDNNIRFQQLSRLEDGFFNIEFFKVASSCIVIPDELYHYRISTATEVIKKHDEEYADLVISLVDSGKEWTVSGDSNEELYKFCLNEIGTCIENLFVGDWGMGYLSRRAYLIQLTMIDTYQDAIKHLDLIGKYRKLLHILVIEKKYVLLQIVVYMKYFLKKYLGQLYYLIKK